MDWFVKNLTTDGNCPTKVGSPPNTLELVSDGSDDDTKALKNYLYLKKMFDVKGNLYIPRSTTNIIPLNFNIFDVLFLID